MLVRGSNPSSLRAYTSSRINAPTAFSAYRTPIAVRPLRTRHRRPHPRAPGRALPARARRRRWLRAARARPRAVLAYIDAASKDQWGRVWDGLHPDQKALFTREAFIDCGAAPPFTIDDVEVVETFKENSSLPGVYDSVPSTAVTLKVTVSSGGEKDTQTLTAHAYEFDDQWWTSVDQDKVAACT